VKPFEDVVNAYKHPPTTPLEINPFPWPKVADPSALVPELITGNMEIGFGGFYAAISHL
jgi:hypothetical protein